MGMQEIEEGANVVAVTLAPGGGGGGQEQEEEKSVTLANCGINCLSWRWLLSKSLGELVRRLKEDICQPSILTNVLITVFKFQQVT